MSWKSKILSCGVITLLASTIVLFTKSDGLAATSNAPDNPTPTGQMTNQYPIITIHNIDLISEIRQVELYNPLRAIAWSPTSYGLAIANGNDISLYDFDNGLSLLGNHDQPINAVAFSQDGKKLASASDDGIIKVWDIDGKTCLTTIANHNPPYGEDILTPVYDLIFADTDDFLISGDAAGILKIWSLVDNTEQNLGEIKEGGFIHSVALNNDETVLAFGGGWKGNLYLLNMVQNKVLLSLGGHTDSIYDVSFSSDGKLVASGSWDGTIRLWEIESGSPKGLYKGHEGWVTGVIFSVDETLLFSTGLDGTMRAWDPSNEDGSVIHMEQSPLWAIALNPEGTLLAFGGESGILRIWSVE
ncbi:MAG: WD40 repeat domain-containing protein [Anaerolineae bacterium]|nr:WD40 repeat domain-containing protein [Anaerolineae bacterium]